VSSGTFNSGSSGGSFESLGKRFDPSQGGDGGGGRGKRDKFKPKEPLGKLFDRQPPVSIEAELSLLGAMILDHRMIGDVVQVIKGPESFYEPNHGLIYEALVGTYDKHHSGDLTQLKQWLEDRGVLEQVGGVDFLIKLAEETPVAVNAAHYARIVADKHRLRRLIEAAGQILFDTYHVAPDQDTSAVIDTAERLVFEIAEEESTNEAQSLKTLLDVEILRLEAKQRGEAPPSGVLTGFHELDGMLGGLQQGEMLIIAARPSMGKTSFVLNVAEQIALGTDGPRQPNSIREPVPIAVFSLEMSKSSLVQRLLSSYTGINSQHIQRSVLGQAQYDELILAAERLAEAALLIDDTPSLSITQLRARARRMVARHGVKAIMVDYLQLLSAPGAAKESRQVEVGAISRGIKALARELKVPIIALSQLNRGAETRDQNKPRLSDLRESGSLEQDADVVMLLHREEYYHIGDQAWIDQNPDKVGVAEVIIAKQRNGPTGSVRLTWDNTTTRFKNFSGSGGGDSDYGIGASTTRGDFAPQSYSPPPPPPPPRPQAPRPQAPAPRPQAPAPRPQAPAPRPATPDPALKPVVKPTSFLESGAEQPSASRPTRPSFGAFAPRPATGPVEKHRDGGGPDRDDEPPAPPANANYDEPPSRMDDGEDDDEPAPF